MSEPSVETQLATLTLQIEQRREWLQRVEQKIDSTLELNAELRALTATLKDYIAEDRKKHEAGSQALDAHMKLVLPVLNDHIAMRAEFSIMKAAQWLVAGGMCTMVVALVVNYLVKR